MKLIQRTLRSLMVLVLIYLLGVPLELIQEASAQVRGSRDNEGYKRVTTLGGNPWMRNVNTRDDLVRLAQRPDFDQKLRDATIAPADIQELKDAFLKRDPAVLDTVMPAGTRLRVMVTGRLSDRNLRMMRDYPAWTYTAKSGKRYYVPKICGNIAEEEGTFPVTQAPPPAPPPPATATKEETKTVVSPDGRSTATATATTTVNITLPPPQFQDYRPGPVIDFDDGRPGWFRRNAAWLLPVIGIGAAAGIWAATREKDRKAQFGIPTCNAFSCR